MDVAAVLGALERAAYDLFYEHGVEGFSVKQIRDASPAPNQSISPEQPRRPF